MADSTQPLKRKLKESIRTLGPGTVSTLFLLLLIGSSFTVLLTWSPPADLVGNLSDPYLHGVVRFTIWQATLSTFISVGLAIPVARAFARQPYFKGRHALLQLMSLPVVMPVIVAVLGVIAVYGQSGMLHDWLKPLGISWIGKFYGLPGILVAHVFFNLPLSVRLLLPAWDRIPCENWRLAAQLDMNSRQLFRWLEWPALTGVLPGTITVVFLLCFSSFAVVLVLGGGPASTTIEVAIYQALRFEFDPGQAALFALGQLTICTAIVLGMHRWIPAQSMSHGLITSVKYRPDQGRLLQRSFDLVLITLTGLFVALPLSAVILAGITGPFVKVMFDSHLWGAAGRSVIIAILAAGVALLLALGLLVTSRHLVFRFRRPAGSALLQTLGSITLVVPPMVTGTGLFLLLLPLGIAFDFAILMIVLVNATLVLPYMVRTIGPALLDSGYRYDKLCRQLGISGWNRLRLVDWPIIRRPLGFSTALCSTLSLGDMGVAALFDTSGAITLPILLYHRLGAYRFDEAAVTALALMTLCAVIFLLLDRGIGRWHS